MNICDVNHDVKLVVSMKSYMMTCLCKNERTPPAPLRMSLQEFCFGNIWRSLPSLAGSVWTLCSLCCALQADARPPRSTCRGRRSLSLATGCPSPRPRCGTHLAEVRPERLTSPNPRLVFWFFSSVSHDMIFFFLFYFWWSACSSLCLVIGSFSHLPYSPNLPCFRVASWVIVYYRAYFDWSSHCYIIVCTDSLSVVKVVKEISFEFIFVLFLCLK